MSGAPAGVGAILAAMAELTLRRLWRGRALWVSVVIALLPIAFAAILRSDGPAELHLLPARVFVFELLLAAVLPAMFVSSSIGEEIEDRTTTYLWSRALPRWTIVIGKLVALVPIALVLMLGNWFLATRLGTGGAPATSFLALGVGTVAVSCLAAALATVVPKHGMALTICYVLFFDLPVGALPASIRELSITHHMRTLAELHWQRDDSLIVTLLALAAIAAAWLALALARIRRIES